MSKFIKNDYIDVSLLSHEDFIHLHQALEDSGEKMLEKTETRKKEGFHYKYLVYCDKSGWFGSTSPWSRYLPVEKVYSILNITREPNYEVY